MRKLVAIFTVLVLACAVQASWYWPFGSEEDGTMGEVEPPRISELMSTASELIDEASDLAGDGKTKESIEKYRQALDELERIERENPERAKGSEFATVRNKRAYVNAAIDSLLLSQIRQNARAVAVSDTTELEKKLAEEKEKKSKGEVEVEGEKKKSKGEVEVEGEKKSKSEVVGVQRNVKDSAVRHPATTNPTTTANPPAKPATKREQAIADIASGDYAAAELVIREMLEKNPNSAMALNLKAAIEMKQGKLDAAEETLDKVISTNPRNYSAYYNMAMLLLQKGEGNKTYAKRYYETGRTMGGPENKNLEAMFK